MSSVWDHAVRAVVRAVPEEGDDGHSLSYYCGGPELVCEHHACRVVSALADADLLQYPNLALVRDL